MSNSLGIKLIIAGSRTIEDPQVLEDAFQKLSEDVQWPQIIEVVSGAARGVDRLGEFWAAKMGIPVKLFPADWNAHGRFAGFIRNSQMIEYVGSDGALLAVWDGMSPGTRDTIRKAKKKGLLYYVYSPMILE